MKSHIDQEIVVVFGIQNASPNQNDVEFLAEKHRQYESARRLIFSLVSSKGGRIIGQINGDEIVVLPINQAEVIKEIDERLTKEVKLNATIGVGEDSQQAKEALDYAHENAPGTIKVYRPDMNAEKELAVKPLDVATSEQDVPMQKSESYVAISDDEKKQIAQILASVQQNKQTFDQLQAQAPEAYAAIVSVIQSLVLMVQEDKKAKEEHIAKMIEKINKYVNRSEKKLADKHGKEIQKEVDNHYKERSKEDQKKSDIFYEQRKQKRTAQRAHIASNPQANILYSLLKEK